MRSRAPPAATNTSRSSSVRNPPRARIVPASGSSGSLLCPVYNSLEGPFAATLTTIAEKVAFEEQLRTYPFCPRLEEDEDLMVVSEYSPAWKR